MVHDVSVPSRLSKLLIPFLNHLLDGELPKEISLITIISPLQIINHDFIIHTDFTRITASNSLTDDIAN